MDASLQAQKLAIFCYPGGGRSGHHGSLGLLGSKWKNLAYKSCLLVPLTPPLGC